MRNKGFTLLEIIITIIIGSLIAAMFVNFMGSNLMGSAIPVVSVQNANSLNQVMESITADYKNLVMTSLNPLPTLRYYIQNGNNSGNTPYYGQYDIIINSYISFDGSRNEISSADDKILKVTISRGNQTITSVFTNTK